MDIERLRVFITVVEYGSFSKAAQAMYISHSTTSRAVAALEEELGVRLLERDRHSISATPAGELLWREGVKLMKRISAVEEAVRVAAQR